MKKKIILWIFAAILTMGAVIYQRATGPTYPKKETVTLNNKDYKLKLIRSHGGDDDAVITLNIDDEKVTANLFYKNYPPKADEKWQVNSFTHIKQKDASNMQASLPHQAPAGKLLYYVEISDSKTKRFISKDKPIVIRFKGGVPSYILIPHIIFMFLAYLFANVAGLFAAFKIPQFKLFTRLTLIVIFWGGMVLGPIVQKFAFLEYWAGVPFGWDLTDNKLLIAFLAWLIAFFINRKKENRIVVIIATVVTLVIFSIPHSMFGSELNRETGKVIQGFVQLYF